MKRPEPLEIRRALAREIVNSQNHPNPVDVLGRNMSRLIDATTQAIEDLLDEHEERER